MEILNYFKKKKERERFLQRFNLVIDSHVDFNRRLLEDMEHYTRVLAGEESAREIKGLDSLPDELGEFYLGDNKLREIKGLDKPFNLEGFGLRKEIKGLDKVPKE